MSSEDAWIETREWDGALRTRWDQAAGVTLMSPLDPPAPVWERTTASSPWVDGAFLVHSSIGAQSIITSLQVKAASRAASEGIVQALIADVTSTHRLQLVVVLDGIATTYRAYRPDIEAPGGMSDVYPRRDVFLTFPVLPHPTITGTV